MGQANKTENKIASSILEKVQTEKNIMRNRKHTRQQSVSRKIMELVLIIVIIPVLIINLVISSFLISQLQKNFYSDILDAENKISANYKEAMGSVIDVSLDIIGNLQVRMFLTSGQDEEKRFNTYSSAHKVLEEYVNRSPYISKIWVSSLDRQNQITTGVSSEVTLTNEEETLLKESSGQWMWGADENSSYSVIRLIRTVGSNNVGIGYLKIILNSGSISKKSIGRVDSKTFGYAAVAPDTGSVVMSSDPEILSLISSLFSDKVNWNQSVIRDGKYLVRTKIEVNTHNLFFLTYAEDQSRYYFFLRIIIILMVSAFMFLFYFVFSFYYKKTIGIPLETMGDAMKEVQIKEEIPCQVNIHANGEIGTLVDSYNAMVRQLDQLYSVNYQNEIKLRDANLLILQSEINPHFLYNVLDSIRWTIELEENEKASAMVRDLSEMFRASLKLSDRSIVALDEEIEHVQKYLAIEKYRFGDKFTFILNLQENLNNPDVIKFILQPLIENALVHGLMDSIGHGTIVLSIYIKNEELVYDLRDDGAGADPDYIDGILHKNISKKNSLEGFALTNIQERIQLKYGSKYGITYSARDGGGSVFTVRQPLVYGKGGDTDAGDKKIDDR